MNLPKRRWLKRLTIGFAVAASLWLVCWLLALWDLERARAEVRQAGGFATWEEFVASEEARPESKSGADDVREAIRLVGDEYTKDLPNWWAGHNVVRLAKYGPTSDPAVQADLKVAKESFLKVDQAIALEPGRLTKDLRSVSKALTSSDDGQRTRTLYWLCEMDLSDALGCHDDRRAVRAVERSFGIADQLSADPIFVSQVIRSILFHLTFERLQLLLRHATPTPAELESLDRRLAIAEERSPWGKCFRSEGAGMAVSLQDPESLGGGRNRPQNTREWLSEISLRLWEKVAGSSLLKPKHVQWQAAALRAYTAGAALADKPPPLDPAELDRMEKLFSALPGPYFGGENRPPGDLFSMYYSNGVRLHQQAVIARLGLRIVRYRIANRDLPVNIDDFCQEKEKAWFVDKNIKYERLQDGFVLSSRDVGWIKWPYKQETSDWSRFEVRFLQAAVTSAPASSTPNPNR